jgi:hypothetical protein
VLTAVVGADPFDARLSRPETRGFSRGSLAMDPARCKGGEPWTGAGQVTDHQVPAALGLGALRRGFEPLADELAQRPGRMGPAQPQGLLVVTGAAVGDPGQRSAGDLTYRPPVDTAPPHGVGRRSAEPVAGQGLAVWGRFGRLWCHEAPGRGLPPRAPRRWGQAAPPTCGLEAPHEGGDSPGPSGASGRTGVVSPIRRVGTGTPGVGACPAGPQPHAGSAAGRRAQRLGAQAHIPAGLGQPRQRPGAARVPQGPRALGL